MKEVKVRTSSTAGENLLKFLIVFFFTAYLMTYLTGSMEGFPTLEETFDFTIHVMSRLFGLIKKIVDFFAEISR